MNSEIAVIKALAKAAKKINKLHQVILMVDVGDSISSHDFGKNIIPEMLGKGEKIYAYPFNEYWRDVGTVESLYEAHMDLLASSPLFDIHDMKWPIYSTLTELTSPVLVAHSEGKSIISESCFIHGEVENSIIFPGAYIGKKAKVKNSIIMPDAYIGHSAYVEKAIIGPGAAVENGCAVLGGVNKGRIAVVGQNSVAPSPKNTGALYCRSTLEHEPNKSGSLTTE